MSNEGVLNTSGSTPVGTGRFPVTPFVVGPSGQAGYQTIQSAITAASSAGGGVVYIQPGTYTENISMGENVHLVAAAATTGDTGGVLEGGESPLVQIIGNFVLDVSSALATTTNFFKNIYFSSTSGVVFRFLGNNNLVLSAIASFSNCQLNAGDGSSAVFFINSFMQINLDACSVTESTPDTGTFFSWGSTPFLNLNARDSSISINSSNAFTIPASSDVNFLLTNTRYRARVDASTAGSGFSIDAYQSYFEFSGPSSGDPLVNFGSQPGHFSAQNCFIIDSSGSLANSTDNSSSSYFKFDNCVWYDTLILGTIGRGNYFNCVFSTSSSSAITMSSSQNISMTMCTFDTSNSTAIGGNGSGVLSLGSCTFVNNYAIAASVNLNNSQASIFGEVRAGKDLGGATNFTSLTNGNSTVIGAGTGTVKMSSANNANNAAWIKIYIGTTAYWIPAWTTNSP